MALGEKLFEENGNITGLILAETVILIHCNDTTEPRIKL